MKKSVVSALTTALVVGATATTFAAANPFSDVPAGHWAYNSVTKLAAEGIIEGYGDGTFLGNRNITRYEMAQMIAKALAKNPQGATKAELDKLAAEFREELDNLGVRVSELEKHADKVKWTGEVRYRYWYDRESLPEGGKTTRTKSQLQLRLFPTAEINDHWTAKARLTATENFREDSTGNVALTYIYAEGKYGKFTVDLGRMPLYTKVDEGIVADDFFSGAKILYGDKFKVKVEAGRWNNGWDKPADYLGGELLYDDGERFNFGVGYRHFKTESLSGGSYGDSDKANIVSVGAGYNFNDDVNLGAYYAHNNKADKYKNGYNIELSYKGANKKAGSWGAYVAYRYVGENVGLATTFDTYGLRDNKKGIDLGLSWSPFKNTLTMINYFHGKTLDTKENDRAFFGRMSWFF
ncbi:MAG: S-layer homology domain-containing protein [Selenomonadaceae bacterium]|nr:S-layer homology domain-containing protein [Selenomonadaceae bacterium]